MLDEGAGARSALEIADAVEFLGADLGATSSFDSSAVRLHVPVARLADALPIMADVALRPTFPKDELERLRQQRLTALLQARDDPATIAVAGVLARRSTARRTATARRTIGTAETIKAFTRRRSARVLRVGVPARQRDAARRRRRHARQGAAAARDRASAAWKAPAGRGARVKLPAVAAAGGAADLPRRQAGRAAVADPHRLGRRAALDARLLSASGAEHDSRRLVHARA